MGIGEVVDAIRRHREHLEESGQLTARRASGKVGSVLLALERRFGSYGIESAGGLEALAERVRQAEAQSIPRITRTLAAEIEQLLRALPP